MHYAILPVTPFQQNCTLFWCDATQRGAVVDPGGNLDEVLDLVAQHKFEVQKILITHGHLDHAGATAELAERLGVPIEGPHRDDNFWIEGMAQQSRMFGFGNARPFKPDRWLEQGDQVTVGNVTLQVLHCPGHTPGHVVFFDPESRIAQVGDVLFAGSIGRTDFPRGNHRDLLRSIRERLFPLGDDVRFIPGHGPMSSFGEERSTNPYVADWAK
ncbi:MAG: MBL fold metallo-hydrolase [Rhodocyclaceae bacterium]|nr:MBL fold metallo-hydrolase [Rhodocyclaceae bacterium]MBX3669545.1 MBL fold metallo-hydrolase [Rhodocyclaceae bacterium]